MAAREKPTCDETATSRESASKFLEQRYVYGVYQQMSGYFRHQHYNIWPNVEQFLTALPLGSLVADIGCGNGKYLGVNAGTFTVGADICAELVEIAGGRAGNEVLTCDNLSLPYRDNAFDAVISIGVVHHFTSAKRRQQAVKELCRVLRPGGKLMICVWAFEQRHRKFGSQDVLIPWCNNDGKIPINEKERSDHNCSTDANHFLAKKLNSIPVNNDSNPSNNDPESRSRESSTTAPNSNYPIADDIKNTTNSLNRTVDEGNIVDSILQSASNVVLTLVHKRVRWLLSDALKHRNSNSAKDAKRVPDDARNRQSVSVDEEVFAVREFPQSSCPKKVAKQLSLDATSLSSTKYSLYIDSHGRDSGVSLDGFERTTEVFSAFEQQAVLRLKKSRDPSGRISTSSHEADELCVNNITRLDSASTTKTRLNGLKKIDSAITTTTTSTCNASTNVNNPTKNTSHQTSPNLSFKQFKLSYHNRMIKQPVVPSHAKAVNGDTQHDRKVAPPRINKSGNARRVRTLSASQTILHHSDYHKVDDFRSALTRDIPPPLQRLTRKLSTGAIVDSNASHANISCDSEVLISKMIHDRGGDSGSGSAVSATHPGEHDYLNQDACLRFYHVFSDGELVELIRQHVPQLRIVEARYEHANWCVVAQKIFQPPTIKKRLSES